MLWKGGAKSGIFGERGGPKVIVAEKGAGQKWLWRRKGRFKCSGGRVE